MDTKTTPRCVIAIAVLGLFGVGGFVAAAPALPQSEPNSREGTPGPTIPLKLGESIPLAIQSAGVEWRGGVYRLVELRSIQFDFNGQTSRLTAQIKADVRTFDNVDYDVSVAVFDAAGKLLGADRTLCSVPHIMHGKSTILERTINFDFGVSLDYSRATAFTVGVSKRKVLTPDDRQKVLDTPVLTPKPITLKTTTHEGWRIWQDMGHPHGSPSYAECLTSMSADSAGNLWIGTSRGRLFSLDKKGQATLQVNLKTVELTGIAVDGPDKVWLSTDNGIRRITREKDAWKLREYLQYYEGHPTGVSGGYIPDPDGVRLWGYVNRIYIPPKNRTYAPLAVSVEHGLFCHGAFHDVWDHFMAHYWGGSSEWLDLRDVIRHRRPTRIVEDADANLWVGTQWDGLVRFNAPGRNYHKRSAENKADGTEFSFFDSKDVGYEFDRVIDLKAGLKQGVWAVLAQKNDPPVLARFDGKAWSTFNLPKKSRKATCIAEITPGVVLVGSSGDYGDPLAFQVDWKSKQVEEVPLPPNIYDVFEILVLPDGRVFAVSWSGLFERTK
jgi:hypothetical protein